MHLIFGLNLQYSHLSGKIQISFLAIHAIPLFRWANMHWLLHFFEFQMTFLICKYLHFGIRFSIILTLNNNCQNTQYHI
jgi:hypothetical protein